jgi:NAD(P)-dependent dehydrogenase (short-subunit alcohol dehydrogenase family)
VIFTSQKTHMTSAYSFAKASLKNFTTSWAFQKGAAFNLNCSFKAFFW